METEHKEISSSIEEFTKRYEIHKLHYDLLDRLMFVVATALGLMAALAWDDVFHTLFNKIFIYFSEPMTKLGYAATLTVLAALTALMFRKISISRKKKRLTT